MLSKDTFDILPLIGRQAAGKSEIIDYLKRFNPERPVRTLSQEVVAAMSMERLPVN